MREIADHGSHVEGRKAGDEALIGAAQRALRNVDSYVGAEPGQLAEEDLGLYAGAGAELDEDAAIGDTVRHLGRMGLEDRRLRARGIVLRQSRDLLEQLAAARVIKKAARQSFLRPRQAVEDGYGKLVVVERKSLRQQLTRVGMQHHSISVARRRPMNCQRWWG